MVTVDGDHIQGLHELDLERGIPTTTYEPGGEMCVTKYPKKIFEAFSRIFGRTPEHSGKSRSATERAGTGETL